MSTLGYILVFTFIGSIGSLIGGMLLLLKKNLALKVSHLLAAFAAGALLGTAFFDLLPEAQHEAEHLFEVTGVEIDIFLWTLIGIIIFFLIERFMHWYHHHEDHNDHEKESKTTIPLIIISDTMHNFLDGMVIAATFLVSIPLGIVTTFAVAAHEIPQEIGDFGLMLHKGMSRGKILLVNVLSAGAAFTGAILMYTFGESLEGYLPHFLAVTAGFFIYIAASDIIPEIHYSQRRNAALQQVLLLLLGIVVIWLSVFFLHESH